MPAPAQPKQTMMLDSPSQGRIVITAEPFALTLIGADGVPVLQHIWQHRRRDWPNQDASDGIELARLAALEHPKFQTWLQG